jgi:hypothetical protein
VRKTRNQTQKKKCFGRFLEKNQGQKKSERCVSTKSEVAATAVVAIFGEKKKNFSTGFLICFAIF